MVNAKLCDFNILQEAAEPPRLSYATKMVGAELEWPETRGKGIKIAVLDTGADLEHPELQHLAGAVDMTGEGAQDKNGHGTWCCGAVGANGKMVGVAPDADIYAVKVMTNDGKGKVEDIIAGLKWCLENNIDVISMSLGGGKPSNPEYHETIKQLYRNSVIIVAAAGNWGEQFPGEDTIGYPAEWPECIATIAVNREEDLASFSSRGDAAEIGAAGKNVWGLWTGQKYKKVSGTSMATPCLAGAVCLLQAKAKLRKDKKMDPETLRWILHIYADDLGKPGRDRKFGFGLFSFGRFDKPDTPQREVKVDTNSNQYFVNGEEKKFDVAPIIKDGRTMIEARGMANAFGLDEILWQPPFAIFKG